MAGRLALRSPGEAGRRRWGAGKKTETETNRQKQNIFVFYFKLFFKTKPKGKRVNMNITAKDLAHPITLSGYRIFLFFYFIYKSFVALVRGKVMFSSNKSNLIINNLTVEEIKADSEIIDAPCSPEEEEIKQIIEAADVNRKIKSEIDFKRKIKLLCISVLVLSSCIAVDIVLQVQNRRANKNKISVVGMGNIYSKGFNDALNLLILLDLELKSKGEKKTWEEMADMCRKRSNVEKPKAILPVMPRGATNQILTPK